MSIGISPRVGSRSNLAPGASVANNYSKVKRQAQSANVALNSNPSPDGKFLKIQRKSQLRNAIL